MRKSPGQRIAFLLITGIVLGVVLYRMSTPRRASFPVDRSTSSTTETVKHSIPLDEIYEGGPGKDGIPSIDSPRFISVSEAQGDFNAEGLGLVVSLNGEDRFYPYQILVWHELVNDQIGDVPILVSFCPLCGSGLVFDRRVNGETLEFGVSGKLHNSDLLMYDRKTDTLWQQLLGEAVVGPLTGTKLTQLEANVVPFSVFSQKFPEGRVLPKDTGFSRDYERAPYDDYDTNESIYFPVSGSDDRIHPKTRVLGITIDGRYKAYPEEIIASKGVLTDTFNGRSVQLEYKDGFITVKDTTDSTEIVPVHTFWFAWFAFHPDTELLEQ